MAGSTERNTLDAATATARAAGAIVVPAAGARTFEAFGVGVDVMLNSSDTNGAYSVYRLTVRPGCGSPFHVHRRDDESFYVLDGEFDIRCGDTVHRATRGQMIFLPRDQPHYFRNVGQSDGHLLAIGCPAGHERFFEDASRLSPTPDPAAAMKVCIDHGMEVVPEN